MAMLTVNPNSPFQAQKLFIAINALLLMTAHAHAVEDTPADASASIVNANNTIPTATFSKITIEATANNSSEETEEYTYSSPTSATGLNLSPKHTPQSVTTITSEQIKDQNLETLEDVIFNTPGISEANFDGGKSSASARGFSIYQYSIDGQKVSYSGEWMSGEDKTSTIIYDRAEVVRGAAGLTTGSGRPSASINLIRKRANSRVPTATVSINANAHETYGASIDASAPLDAEGDIRGRFVAEYQEGDTYIDRQSKERSVLYAVIDADLTDSTSVSGGASYQKGVQNSTMFGSLPSYYSDGSKTDWDVSKNSSVDWAKGVSENLTYFGSLNHNINGDWQFEVKGSHSETEGQSKMFWLYGIVLDKQTGLGLQEYNGKYDIERNIEAAEASVSGYIEALGQTHEVRFGASYNKNQEIGISYPATPNFRLIGNFFEWDGSHPEPAWGNKTTLTDYTIKEKSLFASGRFQLTDPMALILGSRITDYQSEGLISSGTYINISHDSVWVPYVGITYDINDNHTVFASYTSIFEPQKEKNINNEYLEPIDGDSYELGVKSSNDIETLQAQFSVFRNEQDKLAQKDGQKTIPGTTPPTQAYYESEGAASSGIDVEVTGALNPNWKASIGYTQFTAEDANDKTINSGYPDRLIKLFTTYDASNWVSGLTLGAGVNWSGDRYNMAINPATGLSGKYIMEDVALVSLMARYQMSEDLALQFNVDNLFDEKYIESVNFNQVYYGDPLTVSGKLSYKF